MFGLATFLFAFFGLSFCQLQQQPAAPDSKHDQKYNLHDVVVRGPGGAAADGQQPGGPAARVPAAVPPLQPNEGGLLADSVACAYEIARHCSNVLRTSDILVLQCLQDAGDDVLSDSCQQELWNIKLNLTQDDRFRQAAFQYCSAELNMFPCTKTPPGQQAEQSHLVLCLVEYKNNMTNEACRAFLTRIESIMFTDMYLVGRFVRTCKNDVEKFNCGRGHFAPSVKSQIKQQAKVIHSQGGTLECLLEKMVEEAVKSDMLLSANCRHEVLRLAEMQADDFNLDRPLFFACRDDRERLCHDVHAGNGQVFNCLVENLSSRMISYECRETIIVRTRLMQKDYKLNHVLFTTCRQAIAENKCHPEGLQDQSDHFFLTYLLLCLEEATKQNKMVPASCHQQMVDYRRLIMSEAQMHPQTVLDCAHDIEVHCQQLRGGGETLHCLMGVAKRGFNTTYRLPLSDVCFQSIDRLLKVVDVGSDYKVDQVLYHDCKAMIEGVCKKEAASEADVMSCLMTNVESPQMSDECEERLLEVQYFMARDFSLDPQLYKACKDEAEKKCGHTSYWIDSQRMSAKNQPAVQGPDKGYMVLSCLYRHVYEEPEGKPADWKLSAQCTTEVMRVMRERASSVHLLPEMEQACLKDLAEFCSQSTKPGQELLCLQDKYEHLSEACRKQVKEFTAYQAKDSRLDRNLNQVCRPVMKKYCQDMVIRDVDEGEVTECLVSHRGVPEMNPKCEAYVNHLELLSLKDVEFSFKFSHSCKREIQAFNCVPANKNVDKLYVIRCLSEALVKRALLNEGPKISKECKRQMHSENFKAEKLPLEDYGKVDTQFVTMCKADLEATECEKRETVEDAIECLKERKSELNSACRKYIFRKEKLEFGDNTFDVTLNRVCAHEIRQFCLSEDKVHVLHCLINHVRDPEMSGECLQVVQRRQKEQASDIRLQPVLYEQCLPDLKQHCPKELEALRQQEKEGASQQQELEARTITCLRQAFVDSKIKKPLRPQCVQEVMQVIYASEIDPQLDPPFYKHCMSDIKRLCETTILHDSNHDNIMECMKTKFRDSHITDKMCLKEMERKLRELLFDIHLDEALYQVCQLDLKHYCYDITPGNGNQLKCLLMASHSSNVKMSDECKDKLLDRQQLWKAMGANEFKLPEGLSDFATLITTSPSKNYLQTVLLIIVLVIFVVGLCFGRVTKRVRREMKNR